jgi:hypothetical protein
LYIIDEERMDPVISYFPKSLLSGKADERFQELFRIRSKWEKSDILPYSKLIFDIS